MGDQRRTDARKRPATYTVIGGGCYGSFYTRQLLRYADQRAGPVSRIVVVDRDPDCQVAREVSDIRVTVEVADWVDHLAATVPRAMALVAAGDPVPDRLVPWCYAPHILLETLGRVAAPRAVKANAGEARMLFETIDTPFVRDLGNGSYALSFATWTCPVNCIEPATCPALAEPLTWNMSEAVARHVHGRRDQVRSFHILECLNEAFGVGTIPIADIAREAIRLREAASRREGAPYSVIATVSTCHGVAGVLRLA